MTTQAILIHLKKDINEEKAYKKIAKKLKEIEKNLKKQGVKADFKRYELKNNSKITLAVKYDGNKLDETTDSVLFSGYLQKHLKEKMKELIRKIE
ncbi:MAG: hypothetical protein R6U26_01980 [Candidatus Undinarchaeales archaeon]